ncbi:hypothetical protein PVAP13_9KG231526 [Panicum virgatum]|uniref:Uncharacterized protein n=1 Tax=Panicum virgatum TaxID=38727 RepID=A0A8T0NQC5_PANVG|nr:hypothetical protein PVAP13_9KG231526 [Panicum virgatum]
MRWVGLVPLVRIGATRPPAQLTRGDGESEGKRRETSFIKGKKKREKAGEKQCHQPAHHSTDAATLSRFFSSRTHAPPAGRRISVDPRSSRCLAGISRRRPVSATRVHDASTMCVRVCVDDGDGGRVVWYCNSYITSRESEIFRSDPIPAPRRAAADDPPLEKGKERKGQEWGPDPLHSTGSGGSSRNQQT